MSGTHSALACSSYGQAMELVIPTTVIYSLPDQGRGHTKPRGE